MSPGKPPTLWCDLITRALPFLAPASLKTARVDLDLTSDATLHRNVHDCADFRTSHLKFFVDVESHPRRAQSEVRFPSSAHILEDQLTQ